MAYNGEEENIVTCVGGRGQLQLSLAEKSTVSLNHLLQETSTFYQPTPIHGIYIYTYISICKLQSCAIGLTPLTLTLWTQVMWDLTLCRWINGSDVSKSPL
jgi:hypothetical protein